MNPNLWNYKEKDIPDLEIALAERKQRLLDVQTYGDAAISKYDLSMGYDAEFYLVTCPMLQNQVNFYQEILDELKAKRDYQLTLF